MAAGLALVGHMAVAADGQPVRGGSVLEPVQVVPAVSSTASGRLAFELDGSRETFRYVLEYSGLEGEVGAAQLRFGQRSVNGGILAWLCGSPADPGPAGTPACPQAPGRVEGALTAAQVVGPAGQGVGPGRFDALVEALGEGLAYVDVRSTKFAAGELRGQLTTGRATAR